MGEIVRLDEKGRVVIPSSIRNKFGISEGDQLVIEVRNDEIVLSRMLATTPNQEKAHSLKDFLSLV